MAMMEAWLQVFDGEFDAGHKEMSAIFNLNEGIFRILYFQWGKMVNSRNKRSILTSPLGICLQSQISLGPMTLILIFASIL